MEEKKKSIIKRLKETKIDRMDSFFYIGLSMIGFSILTQIPWLAFCVVGSVLLIISVVGAFRK